MLVALSAPAFAQTGGDEPKLSVSGYVQPQYEVEFRGARNRDRVLLRRLVVALDAELSPSWRGELQTDLGPTASGDDRVIVKNAFIQFTGWNDQGIVVTLGNQKIPFSRSILGSSSRRGLVERPFTGDRSLGSPGRALSLNVSGWHRARTVHWSASAAETRQSRDPGEVRLDGVAELGDEGSEGQMIAGRVEFHPLGEVAREQGDFDRSTIRFTVATAAYGWWNDGDVSQTTDPLDAHRTAAFEISGGLRGGGLSVDAEVQRITSRAVTGTTDAGLFVAGRSVLRKGSLEAGYMLIPGRLEALAAVDGVGTAAYARTWKRASAGVNWYVRRHDLKFSVMHRESFNDGGQTGVRSRAVYLQTHFAF